MIETLHTKPIRPHSKMTPEMQADLDTAKENSHEAEIIPLSTTCEIPLWVNEKKQWTLHEKFIEDHRLLARIKADLNKQHYALIRQSQDDPIGNDSMNLTAYEVFMNHIMANAIGLEPALMKYGPAIGDFCVLDRPLYPGTQHIYKTGIDTLNLSRQHNELGYGDIWPKYIGFLCMEPPVPGQGITTLCCGKKIATTLQKRAPALMDRLLQDGVQYIQLYLSDAVKKRECIIQGPEDYCHVAPTWHHSFGTDNKHEAVERCKQQGGWDTVDLQEDDCILVSRVRPVFLELQQTLFYFNTLVGFSKRPFREVRHGNGEPFTMDEINLIEAIQQNTLMGIHYRKGDILIVDNEKMMHGRTVRDMTKPREIAVVKGIARRRADLK